MASEDTIRTVQERKAYSAGFVTDIESEKAPKGLSEDIVRFISAKKDEPQWLLEWRLKAYAHWLKMPEPAWARVDFPAIDYEDAYYYAAPKMANRPKSLDEVDPKLLETYEKLGVPLKEREILAGVAVDAVFDSVSVATTFREELAAAGVIFCSISDATSWFCSAIFCSSSTGKGLGVFAGSATATTGPSGTAVGALGFRFQDAPASFR